ncbi:hypothetical protein BLA60_04790 [Actinophytocola xinjiangensis]|uniref:Phosphopantetheine binding protein n=2 Tax=Actinophytocola xinjiangensis TaxID=485602 RepID=A0A7Z1B123_9PSEU|nr:hypothetical protein BLA60_04790 [Actinophytocola xinjiangensis]
MSARVPGAATPGEFWANLSDGRESISFPTEEELLAAGVRPGVLSDPQYVRAIPTIDELEHFDGDLFGMSRREMELCDPQIRLFLELSHAAIENAGHDPFHVDGAVGVFGATGPNDYLHHHLYKRPDLVTEAAGLTVMTSNNLDYLTTLTSYKLDLTGPSFTVLSACSSSLVALHLAGQSLRSGECDMAVVGAASVLFPFRHGYRWTPGSVWSRDGHCRALDANASGTIFGNGGAAIAVKRLTDAQTAGDNILALVPAIAINNDGGQKSSFSAPSVTGQAAVVMEAMSLAGFTPADMSYVEMHATGTLLGDPIEMASLTNAYRLLTETELEPASCAVGSVKSNIGHMVAAAGLVSLIKVVLSLRHDTLPPSINVTEPNPKLRIADTPFRIDDRARPWPRVAGRPRRAGVSSFGIGGTNAHLVVEEAPRRPPTRPDGRPRLVVWSARSETAELDQRARLGRAFTGVADDSFADAVATLQQGRTAHPVRASVTCADPAEVARALTSGADTLVVGHATDRALVFAFPGADEWDAGVARALYGTVGPFTVEVDELAELFERAEAPVLDRWLGGLGGGDAAATYLVQVALARTLRGWGLDPVSTVGTGTGRFAAATLTGALAVADAVTAITMGAPVPDGPTEDVADGASVVLLAPHCPTSQRLAATTPVCALPLEATDDAHRWLLTAVGRLWTHGHQVSWPALDPGYPVHRAALPGYPYQRQRAWIDLPSESPAVADTPRGEPTVPLYRTGWAERPRPAAAPGPATGTAVVLLPTDSRDDLVLDAVRAAGHVPVPVPWPHQDRRDPTEALDAALRDLGDREVSLLVHAVSLDEFGETTTGTVEDHLSRTFLSLFLLAQRAPQVLGRSPEIVVVTTGSSDVSGCERIDPAKATLHGLALTLRREPGQRARLVDVGPRTPVAELAAELTATDDQDIVALRGRRRWIRQESPLTVGADPAGTPLRERGRYLITGGLGGLGLALARGLTETGLRPRLVLLQRRAGTALDADTSARLREITELGATVDVVACDVADTDRLRATIGDGEFHGVFHLAGLAGGGLVRFRTPAEAMTVLRPKVHGTLALAEAFGQQPELDFAMLFSSQSGVRGVMGSGDYAAACAFQDAVALRGDFPARRVLSVDWPAWTEVGMAARASVDLRALATGRVSRTPTPAEPLTWSRRCCAEDDWFLDEHRLDGVPIAPGTGLLALVLRATRECGVVTGPVVVTDLTFRASLIAPAACEVRVDLRPAGEGWTAELWFRSDEDWTLSTTARVAPAGDEPGRTVDVAGLAGTEPLVRRPPVRSRAARLSFGPRWEVVEAMWSPAEHERYVHLRLPDVFADDLDEHPTHAALLDMATGMLCYGRPELFLPFTYRQVVVHDDLPAEFFSHIRIRQDGARSLTADIDLCTADGRPLMEIRGFTMLVAGGAEPATGEAPARPGAGEASGLDPRLGVRTALALLEGRTPAQVLVGEPRHTDGTGAEVAAAPPATTGNGRPAPGDTLAAVRGIWSDVFSVAEVADDTDFFDLGGDSLSAVEVLAIVQDQFGVDLDPSVIFDAPTVRDFASALDRERGR